MSIFLKKISSTNSEITQLTFDWLEQLMVLDRQGLPNQCWTMRQWHELFDLDSQLVVDFFYHLDQGDGQIIGFSLWRYNKLESLAHLLKIVVDPKFRMKGVGSSLLEPDWIKKWFVEKMFLEVATANDNAINLYQSQGFEILHMVRSFYSNGEDAYKMMKKCRI